MTLQFAMCRNNNEKKKNCRKIQQSNLTNVIFVSNVVRSFASNSMSV